MFGNQKEIDKLQRQINSLRAMIENIHNELHISQTPHTVVCSFTGIVSQIPGRLALVGRLTKLEKVVAEAVDYLYDEPGGKE